jgi:predicted site-specific integrase-resolvase
MAQEINVLPFARLQEAASALGVCVSTARNMFDRGELPGARLPDGERLVDRAALAALAAERAAQRRRRRG